MAGAASGNLALLIDGNNVSHKVIDDLMAELPSYGTASVRRIYGDWTTPNMTGWKTTLLKHSITPMQQFAYTTGKNATDGAMIIDAMDLLYTGRFSCFCIVSSDSDFTRLAARIREQGVTVVGFGRRQTNAAFVAACDEFVYFDAFSTVPSSVSEHPSAQPTHPQGIGHNQHPNAAPRAPAAMIPQKKTLDRAFLHVLKIAINNVPLYDGDFVNLAEVGHYLRQVSPDFNARNYGYARLTDLVNASRIVETKTFNPGAGKQPVMLVRLTK